jgi:hypothetical protein
MSNDLEIIKTNNKKDKENFIKIINSINSLEVDLEKKLENLVEHINFVNELYNQSLDCYHNIVSNLIESNNINTNNNENK